MADLKTDNQKRPPKLSTRQSLKQALGSWRTAAVSLLSFSSGLPLGLVWIAIPDWMRKSGMDIRVVGMITLAQAPWSFKFLWSPFMDRYSLPWLGRRRGWAALMQIALLALTLGLAGLGNNPDTPWVLFALTLAIAFAAASQDIAIDAYAVDTLLPEEQGIAAGARVAIYRAAMYVAGGVSITAASLVGWPVVCIGLAALYIPMLVITYYAPEPPAKFIPPRSLKDAVWRPFLGFLSRHRALEILAFVVFYKLADNLALALLRPFLVDMGYSSVDRGVALATIGLAATLTGTFLGGAMTTVIGLGHSLWLFGGLQAVANLGYVLVANSPVNRLLMFGATGFESLAQGMGTGAFAVLLMRLTQKRFSATQYALFSSMFSISRIITGPISGLMVDALGWSTFFWCTILAAIPGLVLLSRFAPLGTKEPEFTVEPPRLGDPLSMASLTLRGILGALLGYSVGSFFVALISAVRNLRAKPPLPFNFGHEWFKVQSPETMDGWITMIGLIVFSAVCGLFTAAVFAARSENPDPAPQ